MSLFCTKLLLFIATALLEFVKDVKKKCYSVYV